MRQHYETVHRVYSIDEAPPTMITMRYQHLKYLSISVLGIIAALLVLKRWSASPVLETIGPVLDLAVVAALAYEIAFPLSNLVRALHARGERFRLFSGVVVEGVAIQEKEIIIDASDTLAALLGVSPNALIGQHILSFIAPESHTRVTERMANGFAQPYEVIGVRCDGTRFPMEIASKQVIYLGRQVQAFAVRDISARKLIEAALQSSEARFRQIAEHINNVFWMCSPDLDQIIYVSPAYETIWQRPCADVYEHPHLLLEAIHPDDRGKSIYAAGVPAERRSEVRIVRPDGSVRWVASRAFPVYNAQGAVYRVVGISEDITERKHAEIALQESEATIRELYEIVSARSQSFDERLHAMLRMGCRRFGLPIGTVAHITGSQYRVVAAVSPDNSVKPGDVLARENTYCNVTIASSEPVCVTNAGTSDWRNLSCYATYGLESYFGTTVMLHGQIYGTLCFAGPAPRMADFTENERDILRLMAQWVSSGIERQLAEEEIKQQYRAANRAQSESRAVFDAASDSMALVSPAGVFLSVNRRFTELFNVPSESIVGRTFQSFVPEVRRLFAEPEALLQRFGRSVQDAVNPLVDTVVQVHPQQRELSLFSTPVHSQDMYIGRLYAFRDVTHERAVDRMKSEFVSMVSHELRTPLTCIKGYVDMLLDGDVGTIAPVQAEYLTIVKNNSDRLMMLINDLLDVAKAESGRIELRYEFTDFSHIIHDVVTTLLPQMHQKQQQLVLDLQEPLPLIWCDPGRVAQIMTNLLSNAHKYTNQGGTISIHAHAQDGTLSIAVQDNGIGISAEDQAHIFTRFFRAKQRIAKDIGGTGLGLVITRSLVEMHGGGITFESEPGSGSVFRFTLPVSRHRQEPDND